MIVTPVSPSTSTSPSLLQLPSNQVTRIPRMKNMFEVTFRDKLLGLKLVKGHMSEHGSVDVIELGRETKPVVSMVVKGMAASRAGMLSFLINIT